MGMSGHIDGLATVHTAYGEIDGIPGDLQPGDVLIVPTIVGDAYTRLANRGAVPANVTVIVPDTGPTCKRDESGRIISVSQFMRR